MWHFTSISRVTIPCLFLRFVLIFKGTVLEKCAYFLRFVDIMQLCADLIQEIVLAESRRTREDFMCRTTLEAATNWA